MALTEDEELELLELEEAEYQASQASSLNKPDISELESAARGFVRGVPLVGEWADEATGAVESLLTDKPYETARDESRAAYKAAAEANPKSFYGSMAVPMVASSLPKSIPVIGPALSGAVGAIEGAGASENEDLKGIATDAAIAGGLSAGTAGLGKFLTNKLSSGITKFSPKAADKLEETAERQAARALGLERGTAKKLGDRKVRDIGRQALDEKIVTLAGDTDDMIARNNALKELAMKERAGAYDLIDETGVSTFNPLNVAQGLESEIGNFNRYSPLNSGINRQLDNSLEAILQRGGDNIPMKEAQDLLNELKKAAKWSGVGQKSPQEELAQEAYLYVRGQLNKAAGESADQVGIEGLKDIIEQSNKRYSIGKDTDTLLMNKSAREKGNKTFGLTDWITGAAGLAAAPFTAGTSAIAGAGVVGAKKLGERYGAQSMALGADKLADIVRSSPQSFGKFAPTLQKAAERGGNALGVTDFLLQQNDPEYREMKKRMDGEEIE